jgi:tetratricopeptide (TPR) repeat protein
LTSVLGHEVTHMSVAPRPQPEETPEPSNADGWALLEGLRRRLDEQANQNRKTQNEVHQLADSIAAMVAQQRKRSRWVNVNSFVAYVMFTLLCGGAFYFLYQSRAHDLVAERNRVRTERDTAVRRADEALKKSAARDAADAAAWEAYELLQAGKRDDAAKKLVQLQGAPLSKFERTVLETKAKEAEVVQIDLALKGAAASFKAGRHAEVVAPLTAALALDPSGPRAPLMHYYLGVAASKASDYDTAITHLQAAVDGNVDLEDARFHLASVLDRAGQWGKAKVEYDRFATAHPQSKYTWYATRRGGALTRMPAVRPPGYVAPGEQAKSPAPAPKAAPKPAAATGAPGGGTPKATPAKPSEDEAPAAEPSAPDAPAAGSASE